MRIIGGNLRGKKLYSIPGIKIRPTADRLREAIFNILSFRVRGALVLDLFAGTGALGIEALSRGAESAVFIDTDKSVLSLIERNIRSCALNKRAKLINWNIKKSLNCIMPVEPAFDLVFMDPPYDKDYIKPSLLNLHHSNSLAKNACVVVEHSPTEPIPEEGPAFRITDQR
ncbi:MAG: 16S rRNA (guanine(966)-N(2))-methyltransferase RsmD, partial [Deltaproteobacteria bacterium]|nr:16S rRNA (guanine(966)-N(2))-methyltransferase RsmD [Deltaproteobacteria bacterium]